MPRYILVGGNPIRSYTGTGTFTSLRVVGNAETEKEAKKLFSKHYENCGGLLIIVDLSTGKEWLDPEWHLTYDELYRAWLDRREAGYDDPEPKKPSSQ